MKQYMDAIVKPVAGPGLELRQVPVPQPKPAPDGVYLIAEKWGLEPSSLLFIGDSASDSGAAKSAGVPFLSFQNQSLAKHCIAGYSVLREALQSLGL